MFKKSIKKNNNLQTKIISISGAEPNEREVPSGSWASSVDALGKHAFMFANAAASDETFRRNFPELFTHATVLFTRQKTGTDLTKGIFVG